MASKRMRAGTLVMLGIALGAAPAAAQQRKQPQQQVVPPKTVYWMSAATQSGLGFAPGAAPDLTQMMRMAMGGSGGPVRTLHLDLGSRHSATPAPAGALVATHAIPPGMAMGASLPLRSPPPVQRGREEPPEPGEPPEFERPRGKLLLFWGCGETARAGQPVVIDFARVAEGQIPPGLFAGEPVRTARPPSRSSWPTFGQWPNDDRAAGSRSIPASASLVGAHQLRGPYVPTMDFTLAQDWMAGLALRQARAASGALTLSWNAVPGATGHFAQMIGAQGDDDDPTVVFWSSAEARTFLSALSDYLDPAEAARLVRSRQLLPPTQTSCAIPREAMAATRGGMVSLVAHGPQVQIIHPPRPADPGTPWVQEWALKARFVSRASALAGTDMPEMAAAGAAGATPATGKPRCQRSAAEQAARDAGGAVGGSLGRALGGALAGGFGRRKQAEPECVD